MTWIQDVYTMFLALIIGSTITALLMTAYYAARSAIALEAILRELRVRNIRVSKTTETGRMGWKDMTQERLDETFNAEEAAQ